MNSRFSAEPEKSQAFLDNLAQFKSKEVTKPELVRNVNLLFAGHPDLVEGFSGFINRGKKKSPENEYTTIELQVHSGSGCN